MDINIISNFLSNDRLLQNEALVYFENLKNDQFGWRLSIETILANNEQGLNESAIFFCLSIIEHYIKTRYTCDSNDNKLALRHFLLTWFRSNTVKSNYLLNKFAYIVNSVFLIEYPSRGWDNFFDIFLSLCQSQENCNLFLRILLQINADVADREISHTPKEHERNNIIKDLMRDTCLLKLTEFWYNVINTYKETAPSLVCLCLNVIGSYVAWININLITNECIMANLFQLFSQTEFRCAVCNCFNGILHKGMDSLTKVQLIEQFMKVEIMQEKFATINLIQENGNDYEFFTSLAKLFNTIGIELIECLKKAKIKMVSSHSEENSQLYNFINSSIESKFDILCRILSHKSIIISNQVHPFAREYIQCLKNNRTNKSMSALEIDSKAQQEIIILLNIIINQCKYPLVFNFSSSEEVEFEEHRKSCKILFDNLILVSPSICNEYLTSNLIEPLLVNWQSGNYQFPDIEVVLYMLYLLGENSNMITDQKKLEKLLGLLVTSSISTYPNPSIQLIYFELILRYDKYFSQSLNHLVPLVIVSFIDERGFKNPSLKIRSRVAQLFNRFVKAQVKSRSMEKLQTFSEDIIKRLQEFLSFDIVLRTNAGSSELNKFSTSSLNGLDTSKLQITEEDQLLIYDVISVLIISNQTYESSKKLFYLKSLMIEPILAKFEELFNLVNSLIQNLKANFDSPDKSNKVCLQNGYSGSEIKQIESLVFQMAHLILIIARTSKAFSNVHTIQSLNAQSLYLEAFNKFTKALRLNLNETCLYAIQSSIRQLLHRLIVCLDESDIVPIIPFTIQNIFPLEYNLNSKTIQELIPLIIQIVTKFKNSWLFQRDLLPFLKDMFVPLISSIFNQTSDVNVIEEDKQILKKSYYTFLSLLASNGIMDVFINLDAAIFNQIMITLIQGAVDSQENQFQKSCFLVLKKLIEIQDYSKLDDSELKTNSRLNFLYQNIVPVCFYAPLRYQDENALINESVDCLELIKKIRGTEEFCSFLQFQFIPQNFPNFAHLTELIQAFASDDLKSIKKEIKLLFRQFNKTQIK